MALKGDSFYRIVVEPMISDHKMLIPQPFVEKYNSELSNSVTFAVPGDRTLWHLGLTREGQSLYIDEGYKSFMEHYSLVFGHFLLFDYVESSVFDVYIFDMTCTEIEYPPTVGTGMYCYLNTSADLPATNVSSDDEVNAGAGSSNLQARQPTNEDKEKALEAAKTLKTNNPSFMTIMKRYNVKHSFMMYMPRTFPDENASLKDCEYIKLKDCDGEEWNIRCIKDRSKPRLFGRGWPEFVKVKKLDEGDVCVFELLQTNDATLKVTIFRAKEDF